MGIENNYKSPIQRFFYCLHKHHLTSDSIHAGVANVNELCSWFSVYHGGLIPHLYVLKWIAVPGCISKPLIVVRYQLLCMLRTAKSHCPFVMSIK